MLRLALLSFWHVHATDYARNALEHPETEVVAIWDELPARGQREAIARGVAFYERLDDLLAQPDIDAVVVATPTNLHPQVLVAAARAGKHIFTEKVLAITLAECDQILAAVEQAGVVLTVSLPRLSDPYTLAIRALLEQQALGEVTQARVRLAHDGALRSAAAPEGWLPSHFFDADACGGGALIDLGCHPMYLARLFLGMPESVSAHFGSVTGRAVEDNAVAVLRYPQGALGIVEAGFVNSSSPFSIEVHGTTGSLLYGTPEPTLLLRTTHDNASGWQSVALPPAASTPFAQWVEHIQRGTRASENVALARDLTALMQAAYQSAHDGCAVRLDALTASQP